MEDLTLKTCKACEGGESPLNKKQANEYLKQTSGWNIEYNRITKEYKFKNFQNALDFVNKVGEIAEQEGHHPDISFGWGYVKIELTTHAVKGLSENDFILAAKINEIKN